MNRLLAYITALLLSFSPLAFSDSLESFDNQKGEINIAGGTAHIPVMTRAAKKIMTRNPNVLITVAGGGSGVGVQKVGEGLVQIGNTGRPLKEKEIEKYGLVSYPFAIDGVAVVVNRDNPVVLLTRGQLMAIYSGVITNWKELGGNNAEITLYSREDGSGTREVFEERGLNSGVSAIKANVVNSNGAMKTAIRQDPNAIGYVGIGHLDELVKGVVIDGMVPSQENAADGSYDITRLLYMNTKGEAEGLSKKFIDYIYSPDGTDFIIESGYLPVIVETDDD